ncbi:unnamed protein product [Medioppia subpectinata]|uniref:Uncharacterized protein n=1 Tax=Medioppia subpectinata TaxID=1979941 RepID=A0A7R9PUF8_9ACAR|nr:unnamed protein product [Medioppia subpectinata]CAG2101530.1 unnamed protein product [Medioppia subpectinata]
MSVTIALRDDKFTAHFAGIRRKWESEGIFIFINLRLILPALGESGKAKEFLFSPSDSAADIAQYVFDNWPEVYLRLG